MSIVPEPELPTMFPLTPSVRPPALLAFPITLYEPVTIFEPMMSPLNYSRRSYLCRSTLEI